MQTSVLRVLVCARERTCMCVRTRERNEYRDYACALCARHHDSLLIALGSHSNKSLTHLKRSEYMHAVTYVLTSETNVDSYLVCVSERSHTVRIVGCFYTARLVVCE